MLKTTYRRVRMFVAICAIVLATFLVSVVTIDLGPSLKARAEAEGSNFLARPMHIGRLGVHIARLSTGAGAAGASDGAGAGGSEPGVGR